MTKQNIEPPDGGRIHIVSVWVDESRPWDEALTDGCHETSFPKALDYLKKFDYLFPSCDIRGPRDIFLVNFGREIRNEESLAWAWENDLIPVTPRAVLAIMQNNGKAIRQDLGPSQRKEEEFVGYYMGDIVSLDVTAFNGTPRVFYVWWNEHEGVNAEMRSVRGAWKLDTWFALARGG